MKTPPRGTPERSALASRHRRSAIAAVMLIGVLAGCAGMNVAPAPDYGAIVTAADRTDADRQTDRRRNPELLLAFTGVRPGMKVLDMGAGGGYSTELLARSVGANGEVYAQDSRDVVERSKQDPFGQRAQKPVMKNVTRLLRDYDDPVPATLGGLDLITFFFAYHDTAHMRVDRAKMNRRLFEALKPGGVLVVADHSARPGESASVADKLHRIEESLLRREVEAAGFRLIAEGNFLRHPEDPRDAIVFRPKVPVDEFALKFEKPR